jgi:hypothetical protein
VVRPKQDELEMEAGGLGPEGPPGPPCAPGAEVVHALWCTRGEPVRLQDPFYRALSVLSHFKKYIGQKPRINKNYRRNCNSN